MDTYEIRYTRDELERKRGCLQYLLKMSHQSVVADYYWSEYAAIDRALAQPAPEKPAAPSTTSAGMVCPVCGFSPCVCSGHITRSAVNAEPSAEGCDCTVFQVDSDLKITARAREYGNIGIDAEIDEETYEPFLLRPQAALTLGLALCRLAGRDAERDVRELLELAKLQSWSQRDQERIDAIRERWEEADCG